MFLSLLFIIVAGVIFINTEWGQNIIANAVTKKLSKQLNSEISIRHVSFSLFNKMNLEGVLVKDQQKDSLLSAGKIQVRLTDWFFFKDKIVLHYVGLEDAVINLHRTDSVWNYQYLVDYFSGGKSTGKSKGGVELDLEKISLTNISFLKKDEWRGEDMELRLGQMNLNADEINFATKKIEINSIDFTDPYFLIRNYTGKKPKKIKVISDEAPAEEIIDSMLKWNTAGWQLHVGELKIANGDFKNIKQSATPYFDYFDGRNIDFASVNGVFKNIIFNKDTLTTSLELRTKERSGFEVKSMVADARLTPQEMTFDKLEIKTNNSIIRDYFSMSFDDFSDMGDFISLVRMKARFEDAQVDSDDIAFFAPALEKWKKKIKINGQARGTVDDIFGSEMTIEAGNNTSLNGDISLVGLPDINRTFIDFKANNFRTNYTDAATFLPAIRKITTPRLQNISYLHFNGSFTGFIKDFVTYGTIRTNLGTVTSDLNMKLPDDKEPFYSGNIASKDFQLGPFMNESRIGTISFSGQVKGRGLEWKKIAADVDATINHIVYNNYHYENIKTKGTLSKRIFDGDISIKDSNATATMKGIVDMSGKVPRFNFVANVDTLNLKPLHLANENYSFRGKLDFDFSSDQIDNFLGNANIREAAIEKDGKSIQVNSFTVNSVIENNEKKLAVTTDELDATISGDFTLIDLPETFQLFLNKYYPSYIKKPKRAIRDQAFRFSVKTNYVSDILNLVDSSLQGFNTSNITGRLDTRNNIFELDTDIPVFAYKQYEFQNVLLSGKGNLESLNLSAQIDHLKVSDSLSFPFTKIDLISKNDSTNVKLITESNNKNISGGSINALVKTFDDGVGVKFGNSNFILNGKRWTIEENGEIELRSNSVSNGEIVLRESNQEVTIKTQPSATGDWNDIRIGLKNLNIGDITNFLISSNKFEGAVTGDITIEDPAKTFNVVADLQTDQLRVDNDSIGQLKAHVFYNNKTGKLIADGKTLNPDEKLDFDMALFLKKHAPGEEDEINVKPERYPVKIAERFIGTLFTNLDGYATGPLKIKGNGANRKYIGKLKLEDGGLKVIFTQCYYKFNDAEITFREDALDLGQLKLIDTVTKKTATISDGVIKHDSWRDLNFNIRAKVDGDPMLLLNTTAKDNSSFYGYAKGTGSFELTGPQENMRMKITGKASDKDSAYITIPNTTGRESGIADFLIERKYGRELTDTVKRSGETNLTYDVDITGNPMVNVRVLIDELTNDEIRGRGQGNLRIISGTNEKMTMRGRFDINEGNYKFTFQSFFKKPFELNKNANNYIEWNGDPYHPLVNIEGVYKTEKKVDFTPLIGNTTGSTINGNIRDFVYVIAKLRGDLFKPDIKFDLDFPGESAPKKDFYTSQRLKLLLENENELNKQVAFLVVFNSFVTNDVGGSNLSNTGVDLVVNSISGFLSGQINKVLNNFLSNKLKIEGLNINFSGSLYNPNPFGQDQGPNGNYSTDINLAVAKTLSNNRIIITFEGTADVPFQNTAQFKTDLLKNLTAEFLINKTGTVRATIFYKENIDLLTGNTSSGGAKSRRFGSSLAFRKDVNHLSDLFKGKPKPLPVKEPALKKEEN